MLISLTNTHKIEARKLKTNAHNRIFYSNETKYKDLYYNPNLVDLANKFVDTICTKFDFSLQLLGSEKHPTMYTLDPVNTIVVKDTQKNLKSTLIHELGHHVWHKIISEPHKIKIMQVCSANEVDPNEQFASCVEYYLTGRCKRFQSKDSKVSKELASRIKPVIRGYFSI